MSDHRICFIGDSFVQGTGDPQCLGWAGRLSAAARAKGVDLTAYNLGVRRETSADVRGRWQAECARRFPEEAEKYLVFSFGVNDTTVENGRVRVPPGRSVENFRAVADEARAYRALFIGPPPIADEAQNERIAALCRVYEGAARESGIAYLSVYEPLRSDPVWMKELAVGDGAHPGAAGYERLAALVSQWEKWWF